MGHKLGSCNKLERKMSNSETESTDRDENKLANVKNFKLKTMTEVKLLHTENIYEYIESLHGLVKKQDKKMKKYKYKIKKLTKESGQSKGSPKETNLSSVADRKPASVADLNENDSENLCEKKSKTSDGIIAEDAFSFVDEMRQVAENAQNISNFVYEPTSGLYYDQKSGYYYNAEYGLYYDGNTGCYYNYNQKKNCYEFHSQVQVRATGSVKKEDDIDFDEIIFDEFGVVTDLEKVKRLRKEKELQKQEKERKLKNKNSKEKNKEMERKRIKSSRKKRKTAKCRSSGSDPETTKEDHDKHWSCEDGELSTSSLSTVSDSMCDSGDEKHKVPIFRSGGRFQDIAKKYPPCLRIVVQETNLEDLKVGNLSLITFKGGSLGREGNHDVIIPDVNVSKFHLKFTYDTNKCIYKCVDLGSRNGTVLNNARMSASKTESDSYDLVHGSIIQIGQTKLLCHVHEGNSTCGLCEPGLLIESHQREVSSGSALSHREQLKKIQKKYGLENEKFVDAKQIAGCSGIGAGIGTGCRSKNNKNTYRDRAATRRLKVGSSSDKEKTQMSSADTAIPSDNKGFKMLSKLGWNKGESLGKTQDSGGLLEPINVESNAGYKGLGCDEHTVSPIVTSLDKKKLEVMKKTKERYEAADIFDDVCDVN